MEQNLGYTDSNNGDYGYEHLGLGLQGSAGPSLSHQIVAGIATKQYYMGNLGVNSKSINLTSFDESQPSLLSSLKNQGLIPSLSFGYTAGARYRKPHHLLYKPVDAKWSQNSPFAEDSHRRLNK